MRVHGKILKKILVAIVVILLVVIIAAYLFGEQAVRVGVEKAASSALKVNVTLGQVSLRPLRGQVGIGNLQVDNPSGYAEKTLLKLGSANVQAKMGSLLSDTVKIDEIKLDNIALTIEQRGLSNNLKELLDNIASTTPPATTTTPTPQEKKAGGKNLQIKLLEVTNVNVSVKVLGGPAIPLKLDTIRMENIGSGENVNVAALTGKILAAIASGVAQQGAGILPADITGGLKSGLKGIENIGGSVLQEGKGVLQKGTDAGAGVGGAIKGLFEKKK
jgi:hypothetical protein